MIDLPAELIQPPVQVPTVLFGTVVESEPLMVRVDGDTAAVAASSTAGTFVQGERVALILDNRRLIALGSLGAAQRFSLPLGPSLTGSATVEVQGGRAYLSVSAGKASEIAYQAVIATIPAAMRPAATVIMTAFAWDNAISTGKPAVLLIKPTGEVSTETVLAAGGNFHASGASWAI